MFVQQHIADEIKLKMCVSAVQRAHATSQEPWPIGITAPLLKLTQNFIDSFITLPNIDAFDFKRFSAVTSRGQTKNDATIAIHQMELFLRHEFRLKMTSLIKNRQAMWSDAVSTAESRAVGLRSGGYFGRSTPNMGPMPSFSVKIDIAPAPFAGLPVLTFKI